MHFCFYFPALQDKHNNAIFGSMHNSFIEAIMKLGHKASICTRIKEIDGDILITSIGSGYEKTAAQAMFKFNGPVILNTYNAYISFNKPFLKRWKERIIFAYNPDFATLNYKLYNSLDIPYLHLPLASDPDIFKPINSKKIYDIAFLGNGHSGYGREKYIEKLIKYTVDNKLSIFLAGSGWEKFGYPFMIIQHGEQTNLVYNQTKVCINIHNDRQFAGVDKEMDANNRLFDLAMAGCCQVTNGEKMIVKYFNNNEVASADNPDEWIQLIDYYLKNEQLAQQLAFKARKRAIEEHTWLNRAQTFVEFTNEQLKNYYTRNQNVSIYRTALRYLDQKRRPLYQIKEVKIIRRILIILGIYTKK